MPRPSPRRHLATLLLAVLLAGCAGLGVKTEPPRVNLVALELVEMQLFEQRYRLRLRVQNPNREAIEIEGIDFKVALNDRPFAQGVGRPESVVPGFGEALIEVVVVSTLIGLIDQLRALEQRQGEPLNYRINGRLSLSGTPFSIPFERSGELDGTGGGTPAAPDQGRSI